MLKSLFDTAISELDCLSEESYTDTTIHLMVREWLHLCINRVILACLHVEVMPAHLLFLMFFSDILHDPFHHAPLSTSPAYS